MIFKVFVIGIYSLLILLNLVGIETSLYLAFINIGLLILLSLNHIKYKVIVILYLFLGSYYMNFIYYYAFNIKTTYYTEYFGREYYDFTLIIMSLFLLFIYIFNKKVNDCDDYKYLIRGISRKNNIILFTISIILIIFIILFGKSGQTILESGTYKVGSVVGVGGLAISEYIVLFLALAYKFSKEIKFSKGIIITLSCIYMLKMLLYGGRVEFLQVGILLYILYFEKQYTYIKLITISACVFIFFQIYGSIRTDILYFLKNPLEISLFNHLEQPSDYKPSNAGEVIYNSSLFLGVIKNHIVNFEDRLVSLLAFIMRVFLPTKFVPYKEAYLSNYLATISPAGGGGFISVYFYYYLGFIGVILISGYISYLFKKSYGSKNEYFKFYCIIVFTTFPRWLVYDPITLFKLSGYIILLLFGYNIVHKVLVKISH